MHCLAFCQGSSLSRSVSISANHLHSSDRQRPCPYRIGGFLFVFFDFVNPLGCTNMPHFSGSARQNSTGQCRCQHQFRGFRIKLCRGWITVVRLQTGWTTAIAACPSNGTRVWIRVVGTPACVASAFGSITTTVSASTPTAGMHAWLPAM